MNFKVWLCKDDSIGINTGICTVFGKYFYIFFSICCISHCLGENGVQFISSFLLLGKVFPLCRGGVETLTSWL